MTLNLEPTMLPAQTPFRSPPLSHLAPPSAPVANSIAKPDATVKHKETVWFPVNATWAPISDWEGAKLYGQPASVLHQRVRGHVLQ